MSLDIEELLLSSNISMTKSKKFKDFSTKNNKNSRNSDLRYKFRSSPEEQQKQRLVLKMEFLLVYLLNL